MSKCAVFFGSLLFFASAWPCYAQAENASHNWPSFRGLRASGVGDPAKIPATWDVESGKNIRWKVAIPGMGHSSPIVWGDRIFVTSAVSPDPDPLLKVGLYGASPDHTEDKPHEFRVYCLEASTGRMLWERTAHKGPPKVKRHIKASHANCTPATDGTHVIVSFGSEGLYCYDFAGDLVWKKELGYLDAGPSNAKDLQWGYASSPCIWDGKVFIQCDTRSQKYVAALDIKTGKELWKTSRDDWPTFSSPNICLDGESPQLVVNGYHHMGGYDALTGKEMWRLSGGGDVPVPTPLVYEGLIYLTNAHGGRAPIYAIKASARGDITPKEDGASSEHIAWTRRAGSYMQTPLIYGGMLYACRDNGGLSCLDFLTGKKHYRTRLSKKGQGFTASPVAADGKVFFSSEEGEIHVIRAGPEYELLAVNLMGEITMATPAIANGQLFIRGQHHLFSIEQASPD